MKKEVIAETFTPFYDPTEDRIKLVINYQSADKRIDFMITRAFIINFVPAFDDYLLQYYPQEALSSQKKSSSLKTAQAITETYNDKESHPQQKEESKMLTATDNVNMQLFTQEPELLIKIDFIYDKNSKNTTLIFSSTKSTATAALTYLMMEQLIGTIKTAIPNFSWGIAQNF